MALLRLAVSLQLENTGTSASMSHSRASRHYRTPCTMGQVSAWTNFCHNRRHQDNDGQVTYLTLVLASSWLTWSRARTFEHLFYRPKLYILKHPLSLGWCYRLINTRALNNDVCLRDQWGISGPHWLRIKWINHLLYLCKLRGKYVPDFCHRIHNDAMTAVKQMGLHGISAMGRSTENMKNSYLTLPLIWPKKTMEFFSPLTGPRLCARGFMVHVSLLVRPGGLLSTGHGRKSQTMGQRWI